MRRCQGADAAFANLEDAPLHTPKNLFRNSTLSTANRVVGVVENAARSLSPVYDWVDGGRRANVASKLNANNVTAVISVIAETGSHDQADRAKP